MNRPGKPDIENLWDDNKFDLLEKLSHSGIKSFVRDQLSDPTPLIRHYMIYQLIMIATGFLFVFFAIRSATETYYQPLTIVLFTLFFSFSLLILIHELIHGVALKILGAKEVSFGADLRKFIFYAEANLFVMNRREFTFIALAPLVLVKVVSLTGMFFSLGTPYFYFWGMLMCIHSLFCAGDIGILSVFYRHKASDIYTYDDHEKKISYFFRRKVESD